MGQVAGDNEIWMQEAACKGAPPEMFFGHSGEHVILAQRVCAKCPVRQECLQYALDNNEANGVWGGMSERQRRTIRRRMLRGYGVSTGSQR